MKDNAPPFKSVKDIFRFFKLNLPVLFLIFLLAVISYVNGFGGEFLTVDDIPGIVENPNLLDFGATLKSINLVSICTSAVVNIFGVNPVPFHILILILHIINAYLVLLLSFLLFNKKVSLYSALIYVLLPAASEAIFWISAMGYVFQAFFALLCLILFFLYKSTKNWRFLAASCVTYLLGLILLQTSWALVTPFVLFCLDFFTDLPIKYKTIFKTKWYWGVYLALSAGFWGLWVRVQMANRLTMLVGDYYFDPAKTSPLRIRYPYTTYKALEQYVFPLQLSIFPNEVLSKPVYTLMIASSIALVLLTIFLVFKKSKFAGLILAVFASISPTFSPLQVSWLMSGRYLYLGGAFFAMILALLLIKVEKVAKIKNLASGLLVIILTLYSVRLIVRANDFKTTKALWISTQKASPYSYMVYNNLGDVYAKEEKWDMALRAFQTSIALAPEYADATHNLGYTYMQMGDYENAKKYLLEAYNKNPRLYKALLKLGYIEYIQGNNEGAKDYFRRAKQINPDIPGIPDL